MTSQSNFRYRSRLKFELSYILSSLSEIWQRDQVGGPDFEFELKKIRYEYVLSEKNAIFDKSIAIVTP